MKAGPGDTSASATETRNPRAWVTRDYNARQVAGLVKHEKEEKKTIVRGD